MDLDRLIGVLDRLEADADGYVILADAERAAGRALDAEIAAGVLLVDDRLRLEAPSGTLSRVRLCRLNRHHPRVQQLTCWT